MQEAVAQAREAVWQYKRPGFAAMAADADGGGRRIYFALDARAKNVSVLMEKTTVAGMETQARWGAADLRIAPVITSMPTLVLQEGGGEWDKTVEAIPVNARLVWAWLWRQGVCVYAGVRACAK